MERRSAHNDGPSGDKKSANKTVSKNTLKKRRQRANLKKDPERLAVVREKERERLRQYRKHKKEYLESHPRLKKQEQDKKKHQMRKYREKKAASMCTPSMNEHPGSPEPARSRAAAIREQKCKDRLRKKYQTLKRKEEELKRKNEVCRVQRWRMRIQMEKYDSESSNTTGTTILTQESDTTPFSSPSTERRTVRKTKQVLPDTPRRKARVIQKLAQSPSCRGILEQKGVLMTDKARKSLVMGNSLITSLENSIKEVKPSGGMNLQQRRAYL